MGRRAGPVEPGHRRSELFEARFCRRSWRHGDAVDDERQLHSVNEAFNRLSHEIPLHRVSGNHDVGVDFLPDHGITGLVSQEPRTDHYTFVSGSCRFIAINSSLLIALNWRRSRPRATSAGWSWNSPNRQPGNSARR